MDEVKNNTETGQSGPLPYYDYPDIERLQLRSSKHLCLFQLSRFLLKLSVVPEQPRTLPACDANRQIQPASVPVTDAARNFTKLNELPVELRLKIWRETFPGPRYISYSPFNYGAYHGWRGEWKPKCRSLIDGEVLAPGGPIALKVCHESRNEALNSFFPLFYNVRNVWPIYFAPTRDVLTIPHPALLVSFMSKEIKDQ